jgi:hypothetical protein
LEVWFGMKMELSEILHRVVLASSGERGLARTVTWILSMMNQSEKQDVVWWEKRMKKVVWTRLFEFDFPRAVTNLGWKFRRRPVLINSFNLILILCLFRIHYLQNTYTHK